MDRLGKLKRQNFENKTFIPFTELEKLFTRDEVFQELGRYGIEFHRLDEVVDRVLNGGLKTFAILSAIQDVQSITRFIKEDQFSEGHLDAKLPLQQTDKERYFADPEKGNSFLRKQWRFLAPVFTEDRLPRELDEQTILPFLKREIIGEGGFAKVYKLICKQLERPDSEGTLAQEFNHEVEILSNLRCLQHANIIRLVTAFSKGPTYNFLFPVADGDLKKLLTNACRPPGFETVIEIVGSLWGLSSALDAVHNYSHPVSQVRRTGCHFDIKPNNILYRNGKLLLSDFGLSTLQKTEDGSQTTFKKGEINYSAPECEDPMDEFNRGHVGRASDVWSLGCVLCDILAYYSVQPVASPAAVKEFMERRRVKIGAFVFHTFWGDKEINSRVRDFLENSKQSSSRELSLLARIIERILQFDPKQRPSAGDITRLLFHLVQQMRISTITSILGTSVKPLDLELEIEIDRLKIWSKTVGLNADLLDVPGSTWFAENHNYHEYFNLQSLLLDIQNECGAIAAELRRASPGQPTFRLYYRWQGLHDQLWDGQPVAARRIMFSRLEETMLSKADSTQLQQASKLAQGAQVDDSGGDSFSLSTEQFRRRFVCLASMKNVVSALSHRDHQSQANQLERGSIKESYTFGPHIVGEMEPKGKRVLVEFLTYEQGMWSSHEYELLDRVNSIASLRSVSVSESLFPTLQCYGYYHEPYRHRFGIVYHLPAKAQNTEPINFLTVLEETRERKQQPSLTQRYKLAKALVSYILSFHRGGWLHKGVSATNVIFFPDAFPNIVESLSFPYFIGFNHGRVNDENAYSTLSGPEMEYQHPLYRRNADNPPKLTFRFCQEFDYYSIGLLLMEIAFWTPLKPVMDKIKGPPEEMLEELLKKYVPLVKTYMGDTYGIAVRYCLEIKVQNPNPKMQDSLQTVREDFNDNVVIPISNCLV